MSTFNCPPILGIGLAVFIVIPRLLFVALIDVFEIVIVKVANVPMVVVV